MTCGVREVRVCAYGEDTVDWTTKGAVTPLRNLGGVWVEFDVFFDHGFISKVPSSSPPATPEALWELVGEPFRKGFTWQPMRAPCLVETVLR